MKKNVRWVLAVLLLVATACNGDAEAPTAERTEEASPTSTSSFQLEGRAVEASGSARTAQPTPSPATTDAATATESPATAAPTATGEPEATQEGTAIDQASPGSLALRLTAFSGQDTACTFGEGDVLVVAFTRATTFEPADLTQNETFPNNLVGVDLSVQGQVLDEANCLLVASSVTSQQPDQASPAASPTAAGRATPGRRSPTPARRPQATPTRRGSPTPTRAATPPPANPTTPPVTPTTTAPPPTETEIEIETETETP